MTDPTPPRDAEPTGLNPDLTQSRDETYAEDQHGSTPLDTVSVKPQGPAVWPVIWAVTFVVLVAITLFLIFA
ncbi:hypothetical protein [Brevundimonas viscosa]|uniref:Uncharacterized protein n=1 Tax=Brevundimonas viscosa TaxID=871741 RepID=A0A1I6TIR8_9CAUL|nr:hypothetical protein [Brevundimonas viscosa]SFS89051.1 hypothetical protein SAMN05192570_0099 [Brevundimonas viscosa]